MASYRLGGTVFAGKESIRSHVRDVIYGSSLGDQVEDPVLIHLLSLHPDWPEKSRGMQRLVIGEIEIEAAKTKSKNVLIEKLDGVMDISWRWPLDLLKPDGTLREVDKRRDWLTKIKHAARGSIASQIATIQTDLGQEVDHVYPRTFDRLLFLFLKWWKTPLLDIELEYVEGAVHAVKFADWEVDTYWYMFHERVARLEAVDARVNRQAPIYPVDWSRLP